MLSKRRGFSVFLSLLLAGTLVFTACGKKSGENSDVKSGDNSPASKEKVTVTHYSTNTDDKLYIKNLMPEFEKTHSNIKMEFLTVPYENFDSKLQTLVASKSAPDVFSHYGDGGFIEYYSKGLVEDLTPFMEKAKFDPVKEGIPENLLKIYSLNKKVYGIPVSAYVSLVAYNKDLFDQAKVPYPTSDYEDKSWTFDKMIETAKKLTKVSKNMAESQYGLDFYWSERDMRPVYFGEKVYSDDTWTNGGKPSECYFNSPGVIKAHQKFIDLMHLHKVMPTPAATKGMTGGDATTGDPFLMGKIAMSVSGSWVIANVNDIPFKVGVAAIPVGGNEKVRSVLFVDPLMIIKGSKNPEAALEWIKFLTSKESQEKAVEMCGNPPANSGASEKYYKSFPGVDPKDVKNVVEGAIKYGAESYNHMLVNYSQINDIIKNEYQQAENDNVPAEKVMKVVQEKVTDLLKKSK